MNVLDKLDISDMLNSESDSDCAGEDEIILFTLAAEEFKSKKNSHLSKRKTHGKFVMASKFSDAEFSEHFRLSRNQFSEVHDMIQQSIDAVGCNARQPIGSDEKLGVFLRYLASGDSYKTIAHSYHLGDRTVSKIVKEVAVAIWNQMQPTYLPEPTSQTWQSIATRYEQRWQFPHCVGALGGRHIIIGKPGTSGTFYSNYKNTFSAVLLVIVDADYKFTTVDFEDMGRFSERTCISSSTLDKKMCKRTLLLPEPTHLPQVDDPVPYVFLGDESFPLSENILRPYPERNLSRNTEYQIFNSKLSHSRRTVDCAFGILASQFRSFRRPFENKVDTVRDVVRAACVLHNYLLCSAEVLDENEVIEGLPYNQLIEMRSNGARYSAKALRVREHFTELFNSSMMTS